LGFTIEPIAVSAVKAVPDSLTCLLSWLVDAVSTRRTKFNQVKLEDRLSPERLCSTQILTALLVLSNTSFKSLQRLSMIGASGVQILRPTISLLHVLEGSFGAQIIQGVDYNNVWKNFHRMINTNMWPILRAK